MPSPFEHEHSTRTPGRAARMRRERGDLAYQAMTIGAIVTLLASVWVF
jgi:hypothetical protein